MTYTEAEDEEQDLIKKYDKLFDAYEKLVNEHKELLNKYNDLIIRYNDLINKYEVSNDYEKLINGYKELVNSQRCKINAVVESFHSYRFCHLASVAESLDEFDKLSYKTIKSSHIANRLLSEAIKILNDELGD